LSRRRSRFEVRQELTPYKHPYYLHESKIHTNLALPALLPKFLRDAENSCPLH
jgi:hypothetical protein